MMSFDAIQLRRQLNEREKKGRKAGERKERKRIRIAVEKRHKQAEAELAAENDASDYHGWCGKVVAYQYVLNLLDEVVE